jgi:hypothetical protein
MSTGRIFRILRCTAIPGAMLCASTTPAAAQVEFGPVLGVYVPTASFAPASYYLTSLPTDPGDLAGIMAGGTARIWLGRIGIQGEYTVAGSHVGGGTDPGGIAPSRAASVHTATAQALFRLTPGPGRSRKAAWLSLGLARITHGGSAYSGLSDLSDVGGVFGAAGAWPLPAHLAFEAGLSGLIYGMHVRDAQGVVLEHGRQLDFQIRTGLTWRP